MLGNEIRGKLLDGITLGNAVSSTIVTSGCYGLLAVGPCSRTRVIRNLIRQNSPGDVNLAAATGIVSVP